MADVNEVIEWLGCLVTKQHKCKGCPYNPRPGMTWPYGCIKGQADIVEEARTLLEKLGGFKTYFDHLYGQGLEITNWHMNGDTEPFDNFYEAASEERIQPHGHRKGEQAE